MPHRSLREIYREEFSTYGWRELRRDALAGVTVGAVALPLALAFGVAAGATPAAGIITAIVAGFVIGALSGAPYQISGPTGAMSAVLIALALSHGISGVLIAGFLSGIILLVIGVMGLGRFIAFIPAPVITGFTSGISLVIIVSQLGNGFGVTVPPMPTMLGRLEGIATSPLTFHPLATLMTLSSIVILLLWPRSWERILPGSCGVLLLATGFVTMLDLPLPTIGALPSSLLPDERLSFASLPWHEFHQFIVPALSIAALGAIESLLCGSVGSSMTGIRLQANQELKAQGIGNIVIPFLGGVPATAAIARTGVGIKAGGRTRVVSIVHALTILSAVVIFHDALSAVPLSALAAILIVTAIRMNDWEEIRFFFVHRIGSAMAGFLVTMVFTFLFDLTEAILIGTAISAIYFISKVAELSVRERELSADELRRLGISVERLQGVRMFYLGGPLFFAATGHFDEAFRSIRPTTRLVLGLRAVPFIDPSGLQAIKRLEERLAAGGGRLYLAGLCVQVAGMLRQGGVLTERVAVLESADEALVRASRE